ncbi:MAG: response regulator transcription factor [Deltaproteobacteria bacterium]|nr:response regulator transcription factor [Deltaproteobacteria bacterium]
MRVFIADDSSLMRDLLKSIISTIPGCDLTGEAKDSKEALQWLLKQTCDVAILDICMPGASGILVLELVKKLQPDLIAMILTNYPEAPFRKRCLAAGADFFFDKSKDFQKVGETLQALIARFKPAPDAEKQGGNLQANDKT